MNSGATSERVYDALKRHILSGSIAPGEKIDPSMFADKLNSSVTPVREAFHRLTGERLLETRTSEGFHLPHVHEPGLRDLYAWSSQLVRLILGAARVPVMPNPPDPVASDPHDETARLFVRIAASSGNGEHRSAMASLNDRLAVARVAEARLFVDVSAELQILSGLFERQHARQLHGALIAYHRRRDRAVPEIVRLFYAR